MISILQISLLFLRIILIFPEKEREREKKEQVREKVLRRKKYLFLI